MKAENLLILGVVGVGAYLLYKALSAIGSGAKAAASAVAAGFTTAGNAVGSGFFTLFGPSDAQALGSMTYLSVSFPDGSIHAVGNQQINPDGSFLWNGYPPGSQTLLALQLVKDNNGKWYATATSGNTSADAQVTANSVSTSPGGSPVAASLPSTTASDSLSLPPMFSAF